MKAMSNGPLGILMLDTRFPRIKGDIGNAQSFDFPVIFRRMEGIGSADAVAAHPDRPRVLAALEANARALVDEGAIGLSTSCGFLALCQDDLAARSSVPVATSALLHIKRLVGRRVGVITASARNLTPAHFAAVGAPTDTPFVGLPEDSSFAETFMATARRSIATRSSARSWRRRATCWRAIPASTRSYSNAPTCRRTRRQSRTLRACRCSTCSIC